MLLSCISITKSDFAKEYKKVVDNSDAFFEKKIRLCLIRKGMCKGFRRIIRLLVRTHPLCFEGTFFSPRLLYELKVLMLLDEG